MTPITTFSDGSTLAFGPGKFDNFCIYFTRPDGTVWFPLDSEYFETLHTLGHEFDPALLYRDFCYIYDGTTRHISPAMLTDIASTGAAYGESALLFIHTLSVIYAAMVAEENKKDTKLGKRIKRLGVHQVLHGELSPKEAANYSRGLHWPLISVQCKIRGF